MRILKAIAFMLIFTAAAHAQGRFSAIDFFMHDRFYDTFLRDHYRFQEPLSLRIEYWYESWLDSSEGADEYRDHLHLGGLIPIYRGLDEKLSVDIPFQYRRMPIWAETEGTVFGKNINVLKPYLMSRWVITDRLKSIVGWEYNLKGDDDYFGESNGREICLLKAIFSYDLHNQLNLVAGLRFGKYYYDTDEEPDAFELADRLYYHPAVMLNWHPSDDLIVLLGIPGAGVHVALGEAFKAEARASIDEEYEVAIRAIPYEGIKATLRFLNSPYKEIPIQSRVFSESGTLDERLSYTDRSIVFEIGKELNPAALASLGFSYSPGGDVELQDRTHKDSIILDGKPRFAIGATFTMDIEALISKR
jgi:hypothetical protein